MQTFRRDLRRLEVLQLLLCLPDEIEAAGDTDEVLAGNRASCDPDGFGDGYGRLAHLAADFGVHIGQILRINRLGRIASGKYNLVSPELKLLKHSTDIFVAVAAVDYDH